MTMTAKHPQARERVTMGEAGRLLIPDALLAELADTYGQRIDVRAELVKAEAWAAANVARRKGDHTRLVRSWLLRAATEAERGGLFLVRRGRPSLGVVQGGAQASSKSRAVLALVGAAPLPRS